MPIENGSSNAHTMTAPVNASRCPIFAPSIRQSGKLNWCVTTKYGTATVTGHLTQIHRNLLDAIFSFYVDTYHLESGAIEILVDPYIIASKTLSSRDYAWLRSKLHDMKMADVELILADGTKFAGGIISEWRDALHRVPNPGGVLKGDRAFLAITVSATWMRLYNSTLSMSYGHLLPAIAALPSGVLQALVRLCLTHREFNRNLDEALSDIRAIHNESTTRQKLKVRKKVLDADLSYFGIKIHNNIVFYKQHDLVRFRNAKNASTCAVSASNCAVSAPTCAASSPSCAACQENQELSRALDINNNIGLDP